VRAAYAALVLGLLGGIGLATAVLSVTRPHPPTVQAALGLDRPDTTIDRRRAEAVAVLTAGCMARLGIPWRPVPEPLPSVPDPTLGPIAWADRWGFGLSTTVGDGPTGTPDPLPRPMAAPRSSDRGAGSSVVQRALHGDAGNPGCQATATETVYGLRDRLLRPLRSELDALQRAIEADVGLANALAGWRTCVAEVAGDLGRDRRSLPAALIERWARRLAALPPGDPAALDRLQAAERRDAGILARCEVAYTTARAVVAAPYEARFVERHWTALDAIGRQIAAAEAALPTLPP
jgi:hypothetical protein